MMRHQDWRLRSLVEFTGSFALEGYLKNKRGGELVSIIHAYVLYMSGNNIDYRNTVILLLKNFWNK